MIAIVVDVYGVGIVVFDAAVDDFVVDADVVVAGGAGGCVAPLVGG